MAVEPSSSSSAPPAAVELITSINEHDVLTGRGTTLNEFIGNQRFRSIVEQRREEYTSVRKNKAKQKIAKEVLDHIHALGGRFLKEVETETPNNDVELEDRFWIEVEEPIALEKCKQTLRQQPRERTRSSNGNGVRNRSDQDPMVSWSGTGIGTARVRPSLPVYYGHGSLPLIAASSTGSFPLFARQHQASTSLSTEVNAVLPPHFNSNRLAAYPPADRVSCGLSQGLFHSMNASAAIYGHSLGNCVLLSSQFGSVGSPTFAPTSILSRDAMAVDAKCNVATSSPSTSEEEGETDAASEEEASKFLLSHLEVIGRRRFTEEQEEIERATMTDGERAAALCDLFGKQCSVDSHQRKRARQDLDSKSIEFLVKQMRLEIELIPDDKKRALLEAQSKCCVNEFSDERLQRFLRCEGMNAKLGAQRFVSYWESRREVFGPEKFVLRMALSDALRDELVALEAGMCSLLPRLDSSGRQLLFWDPPNHTREGYTSESMLRAVWYLVEVAAEANHDTDSGIVQIIWDKYTSIWDYDHKVVDQVAHLQTNCWPVKILATHVCCAPWISTRILKPIVCAYIDKQARCRTLFHSVPECRLLELLSSYGIMKDMLPMQMGGTIQLNQSAWIASRRVVEVEEI